ncbi:DUF423 domain-containing protein [Rhizobium sp. 9140]|uniref:DUF423 domain-containing protein n=1 Tax=Rhizobium sp. 9140 TaxID=1761900 RepID=UPI00079A6147|nr:DUF423 domain-containing protein [Rhizobium sp. 9140]CZT35892.1 Uncharacterized membrane protein YgdD, TMEM256/DUF423 family [Rhizobium sp. 9140]
MAERLQFPFPAVFLAAAGLLGLSGVALAAAASHGTDARLLGSASAMCLAHAPALLALAGLLPRLRLGAAAGSAMALGTAIFAGDLVLRHVAGHGLFPMSAPLGGMLMMLGWALIALSAILPKRA